MGKSPDSDPAAGADAARLRALFDDALAQAPAQRAAWLLAHVPDRDERTRLQRMLAADAGAGALDVPLDERAARIGVEPAPPAEGLIGQCIGAFRLVRMLGQGGMATVFLGERVEADFPQQVAVKLLRRGLYGEVEQRLFRRERLALATLSHPHIAHLIDGGVTAAGIPYLVLEYVDGVAITTYAVRERLGLRARLLLFTTVCRAVAAAHRHLIVHRDLKPSNILVASDGTVKLLDFGIAKLLAEDEADTTRTGLTALTPEYAAPEQFDGRPVSTATDVYALGLLLHELLLGVLPVPGTAGKPSAYAAGRPLDACAMPAVPAAPAAALRGDLDNIVLKALAEEPERRYASGGELADDIERHLRLEPVSAHPPSAWYRTRRFVQRHRGGVAVTALLSLGLLASLGLALWQAGVAREQARMAQQEARRANTVRDFIEDLFRSVRLGVARDRLPTLTELVAQGVQTLDADTRLGPAERVDLTMMFSRLHDNLGETERARELGQAADALAQRTLDPMHTAAIGALALRGIQAVRQFDHAAGLAPLQEAARRARLADDPALIDVLDNLAVIEMDEGRPEAALALEREALAERIRRYGADDERTAAGWNNLGYGLTGVGRFEEAAQAYQRTWAIDRLHRPVDSYDVLGSLSNWGWALAQAGEVAEARQRLAEADAGLQALGGRPRFLHALTGVKRCTLEAEFGDATAAAPVCLRMLAQVREQSGEATYMMGLAWRVEALRRLEAGDLDGAAAALEESWSRHPDEGNAEHARGRYAVLQLRALLEWLRGDAGAARDAALAAAAIEPASDRPDLNHLRLYAVLALACDAAPAPACPPDAEQQLAALAGTSSAAHDPRLLAARVALARLQLAGGHARAAADALDAAVGAVSAQLDATQPRLLAGRIWKAQALAAAGDCAAARRERDAAWQAAQAAGRERSPWLREAQATWERTAVCPPA